VFSLQDSSSMVRLVDVVRSLAEKVAYGETVKGLPTPLVVSALSVGMTLKETESAIKACMSSLPDVLTIALDSLLMQTYVSKRGPDSNISDFLETLRAKEAEKA